MFLWPLFIAHLRWNFPVNCLHTLSLCSIVVKIFLLEIRTKSDLELEFSAAFAPSFPFKSFFWVSYPGMRSWTLPAVPPGRRRGRGGPGTSWSVGFSSSRWWLTDGEEEATWGFYTRISQGLVTFFREVIWSNPCSLGMRGTVAWKLAI